MNKGLLKNKRLAALENKVLKVGQEFSHTATQGRSTEEFAQIFSLSSKLGKNLVLSEKWV